MRKNENYKPNLQSSTSSCGWSTQHSTPSL